MKTVFKYPFYGKDRQIISTNHPIEFFDIQRQRDDICIWAMIDTDVNILTEEYEAVMYGTGWEVDDRFSADDYLGTVQYDDMVWHCFIRPYVAPKEDTSYISFGF